MTGAARRRPSTSRSGDSDVPRYNLAEFVETKRRAGAIPVELSDGSTVEIPPALVWPDSVYDALRVGDVDTAVVLILGADQAERFTGDGGTWRLLNAIVQDARGSTVGESSPSATT